MTAPTKGCNGCTLCCKLMCIHNDDGTERSAPSTWCRDCAIGEGCQVYATRPKACADFECVWLASQREDKPLPDEMRPDRCKVVVCTTGNVEGGKELDRGIVAHVDPRRPNAYREGRLGRWLNGVAKIYPVWVTVGPLQRFAFGPKAIAELARQQAKAQ